MAKEEELQRESNFIMLIRRLIIGAFIILGFFLIKTNLVNISWMFIAWLIFWLLTTFPFAAALKKIKERKSIENANFLYFVLECLFLTIGIHYIGGISWWGGIFYSITIIFAHFMLPRKKATNLTLITVFIFFNGLVMLEFFNMVPHFSSFGTNPHNDILYVVSTLFMTDFFLMFLAGILGVFFKRLEKKKKDIELAMSQIEEEKMILEIKVNARTRETRDFANELENKVSERTENLEKRIKELEKFSHLTKGREEKLVELEKEAERLRISLRPAKN